MMKEGYNNNNNNNNTCRLYPFNVKLFIDMMKEGYNNNNNNNTCRLYPFKVKLFFCPEAANRLLLLTTSTRGQLAAS